MLDRVIIATRNTQHADNSALLSCGKIIKLNKINQGGFPLPRGKLPFRVFTRKEVIIENGLYSNRTDTTEEEIAKSAT